MVLRKVRITMQDDSMSNAFAIAQSLERKERARVSSLKAARQNIASRLRVGVGTFENLVRERVKTVDSVIRDRLQALYVREIEAEITRLSHELQVARQCGDRLASQQVSEIETHLAKVRQLLPGGAAGTGTLAAPPTGVGPGTEGSG